MKTYQTLSLIGCIIGIFLMLGLTAIAGIGTFSGDMALNMSKLGGNATQIANQQKANNYYNASFSSFAAGTTLSFFLFLALIPIIFVVKKAKVVGIVAILLGLIIVAITNLWGIVPFALLLPAGILAIRYKPHDIVQ